LKGNAEKEKKKLGMGTPDRGKKETGRAVKFSKEEGGVKRGRKVREPPTCHQSPRSKE